MSSVTSPGLIQRAIPPKGIDTEDLVTYLDAKYTICERHRDPYVQLFLQCLRFWAGEQWGEIVGSLQNKWTTRSVNAVGAEDFRLVDNQIPIYCRHLVSVAAQNMPILRAVPANKRDPDDIFAARVATTFLQWRDRVDQEDWIREQEWLWMLGAGECYRYTFYDTEAGDPTLGVGDITTHILDPFKYMKDPYSVNSWPPKFLIMSDARHVDWISDNYGIKVEPEPVADTSLYYDALVMNVMWGGERRQREPESNSAIVKQFWIPPNTKYPKGWLYVWAGKKLLQSNELQAGQWPFSRGTWYPMIGRMYPFGLIELLMGDQKQRNQLVTLIQEAATKQVRGDMVVTGPMAQDGRGVRQFEYNTGTGAKVTVLGPGVQAVPMHYGADWQQADYRVQSLDRNMHQKAGVNQPSLGQTMDKQIRVGELQMSREGDLQVSQWHLERHALFHLVNIAVQKLNLAKEYYVLPRDMSGFGTNEEVTSFAGVDLRGTKHVITIPTPHLSPAMRQQARNEAYANGLKGPYTGIAHQYAARLTLRTNGLEDIDDELSIVYGPFEVLEAQAAMLNQEKIKAELMSVQAMMAQMMGGGVEGGMGQTGGPGVEEQTEDAGTGFPGAGA